MQILAAYFAAYRPFLVARGLLTLLDVWEFTSFTIIVGAYEKLTNG